MQPLFDILGIGCAAVDQILYVERYPVPDSKIRVIRSEQQCGGLTGTALVAAARLGACCAYAGRLGTDAASHLVEENFAREHISTDHAPRSENYRVVQSTIVVGSKTGTRNVFSESYVSIGAHDTLPDEEVIRSTRVLFVDHHGVPGAIRAAKIAQAAAIPVVADFERDDARAFSELLSLVDHLVLSETFALSLTGASSAAEAASALWTPQRTAVIVTCGADGCWVLSKADQASVHVAALKVEAIDTTGCGDVFHGAYAAGLAFGMSLRERVDFAAATAAIKATRHGGQKGIPTRAEVDAFPHGGPRVSDLD
jgi:sulfofructose kinase